MRNMRQSYIRVKLTCLAIHVYKGLRYQRPSLSARYSERYLIGTGAMLPVATATVASCFYIYYIYSRPLHRCDIKLLSGLFLA